MVLTKVKAVFNAEPGQLKQIQQYVESGRYSSTSEFLREAIRDKILRLNREDLCRQVESYCEENDAGNEVNIVDSQAFDQESE